MEQIWEKKSSIRSRPRRILQLTDPPSYFFPLHEQPLCLHPLIKALGDEAIHYILIQSAYKFMGDIAWIETEVVNAITHNIVNDKLSITFPADLRYALRTVMIDEAYHAYVAVDFMQQVEAATSVAPITNIHETALSHAITTIGAILPVKQRDFFKIIAVCIGENSVTQDLVKITKDEQVNPFFNEVNADHTLDEGRHCGIFARVLEYLWQQISPEDKDLMSRLIPEFIILYLKPDFQREYNKKILANLSLSFKDREQIIYDTHVEYTQENFRLVNPIVAPICRLFEKTGVFSYPAMRASFQQGGLL